MIPLLSCSPEEEVIIRRIAGDDEMRRHLGDLGFSVGATVRILNANDGDLIVLVRDTHVALTREAAALILV